MTCYHPLRGYRRADGAICFHNKVSGDAKRVVVGCGQCAGCRVSRAWMWGTRCEHEASLWPLNAFVTLTYADDPVALDYGHFQLFMRYLRRARPRTIVRFFMSGEYGETNYRPHFHAIIFNADFGDRKFHKMSGDHKLYRSDELDSIWGRGNAYIGGVSFGSAAYCAMYALQSKTRGRFYVRPDTGELLPAEFVHMSLKPGIGAKWYEKYKGEIYPDGKVLAGGKLVNAPRFYDRRFKDEDPIGYENLVASRRDSARERSAVDRSDPRLLVAERVNASRAKLLSERNM